MESSSAAGWLSGQLTEKLNSTRYVDTNLVKKISGHELTLSYLQKGHFIHPHLVLERFELDLKVPPAKHFGLSEIRASVGSRRVLEVTDSQTRQTRSLTLKDWQRTFEAKDRSVAPLSVARGLEFSNTKLDGQVC